MRTENLPDDLHAVMALPLRLPVPTKPALTFTNLIVLAYWRTEVALGCAVSLGRLAQICESRGADYELTLKGLR